MTDKPTTSSAAEFALQALVAAGHVSQELVDRALALPGAPQPAHSGEPVATVQTIHGVTVGYLEAAVPAGAKLYTAPQPVEREPLTHAQAKALVLKYGNDPLHLVLQVERAHGIKGGQHGADT